MIVCSCQQVSDLDIELALLDILNQPEAPIPTPGVVYRYMQKRMQCCGCAPLAVDVIYAKLESLERKGLICPYRSVSTRERLQRLQQQRRKQGISLLSPAREAGEFETVE
jgi:bacterioferritin-associated ferredoxin